MAARLLPALRHLRTPQFRPMTSVSVPLADELELASFMDPRNSAELPRMPVFMNMEIPKLNAMPRPILGSYSSREIRRIKRVPGLIFGKGKDDKVMIHMDHLQLKKYASQRWFLNRIFDVEVEGMGSFRVLPKQFVTDPETDRLEFINFMKWEPKQKLKLEVPIFFDNVHSNYFVEARMGFFMPHKFKVKCTWKGDHNIPLFIYYDCKDMPFGSVLRLRHAYVPKGLKVLESPNVRIAVLRSTTKVAESAQSQDE